MNTYNDLQTKKGRLGITLTNLERIGLCMLSLFGVYVACMGVSILLAAVKAMYN